jgi:hypothetical protein
MDAARSAVREAYRGLRSRFWVFPAGRDWRLAEPKEGSGERTPKTCNSEIKSWRLVIRYQQTGNQNGTPG